jgi:UDP-glucose:(heptosyl)LPS alpha-1,3-glucosyltransferase
MRFSAQLSRHVASGFDVVAGFDALENLDVLYCANPPARLHGVIDRLNPRKRGFLKLERACFGSESRTKLLLLSGAQRADYDVRWRLDPQRVTMIPPTIERSRIVPQDARASLRQATRTTLGLRADETAWLFVGSFPQTKGLDRLIEALPQFPCARVLCVGPRDADEAPFRAQAELLGVASRIAWLGVRDDIGALMVASDLLVHPSRLDITGTVILEAMVNGLPVIATAVCGYAPHVAAASAGRVVAEPFKDEEFVAALKEGMTPRRAAWRINADRYTDETDLTSGLDVAADAIAATPARSRR